MPPIALQKARITPTTGGGSPLEVAFNPKEVKLGTGADWKRQAVPSSHNAPAAQFLGTQARTLTIDLLFDQNWPDYTGQVEDDIKTLMDWTNPTSDSRATTKPNPPMLRFSWGTSTFGSFVAYLKSISVTFSLFDENGVPLRANAGCSFEEVPTPTRRRTRPRAGGPVAARTCSAPATACTRSPSGNTASPPTGAASPR